VCRSENGECRKVGWQSKINFLLGEKHHEREGAGFSRRYGMEMRNQLSVVLGPRKTVKRGGKSKNATNRPIYTERNKKMFSWGSREPYSQQKKKKPRETTIIKRK